MTKLANKVPVTQDVKDIIKTFVNADGTALKVIATAGAFDALVPCLMAATTDTSAVNLALWKSDGVTDTWIGTVRVPAASGTDGAAPTVDLLGSTLLSGMKRDGNGKPYLQLEANHTLKAGPLVAVTAAKTLYLSGSYENYASA